MRYVVSHRTTYSYDADVSDSLGVGYLTPRSLPWQDVASSVVTIDPEPGDLRTDLDHYGNTVTYFQVTEPHQALSVTARSEVEVLEPRYDDALLVQPWETCRPGTSTDPDAWRTVDFALGSALVDHTPEAHAYAAVSLLPGRPLGEAATELMQRIHADFTYEPGATTVTSTIADVLETRAGVCQDFAHLTLACLRSHGLAVRYVSGYLATDPPPGKERIVGADASHAWAAVWLGQDTWLALDPTNDQRAGERYVTVAWGRDYGDVPPLKGVIFTDAKESTMGVEVDVAPVVAGSGH
ncbi:hypothetical protein ASD11_08405 [Aeromicrobium sp. Root495]|uniref:transglutaminase family protein n=1 Tax=Aeromicrobium sp. Root495 TaxID=1736550 RepID=UPI0006F970E2|nr:transglutaminase family protein [Aeromicrobium sp. Root495]KQY59566.1 hypothetical protein ASD11_08405 [Aeromicrobium sp. Root495]